LQAAGGIGVGDDRITPAVKPDIVLSPSKRTGRADQDKAALLALAADLRKKLDARYSRRVDSSDTEVIPYLRQAGGADYVFIVTDRREFGQYVGQHGLVMENGVPSATTLSLARESGTVYDLVNHRPVPVKNAGGRIALDLRVGPCDGGLYLVSGSAIDPVTLDLPESVERGARVECRLAVVDAQSRPIEAVVPVEVTVWDAETRVAERSGYYAARGGTLTIPLDIAANDPPGTWRIEVRELASGRTAVGDLRVVGPKPWPPERRPVPKGAANAVQPRG